jgi:hypothetical protein
MECKASTQDSLDVEDDPEDEEGTDQQETADFFPFESWTMMSICAWRVKYELPRAAVTSLLEIISNPKFMPSDITCHSAQALNKHLENRLPLLSVQNSELSVRKRKRTRQKENGRPSVCVGVSKCVVPYISLLQTITRYFSDPVRTQFMHHRLETIDHDSVACREPNQTPLLHGLCKWSKHLVTRVANIEYCVSDFVELQGFTDVYRLEGLFWGEFPNGAFSRNESADFTSKRLQRESSEEENCEDISFAEDSDCEGREEEIEHSDLDLDVAANDVSSCPMHPISPPLPPQMGRFRKFVRVAGSLEVIETQTEIDRPVRCIRSKLAYTPTPGEPEHAIWCSQSRVSLSRRYEHPQVQCTVTPESDNEDVAYVEIFQDAFQSTTTTQQSRVGLYFRLLNFVSAVRGLYGITGVLSCWSAGASQTEALALFRSEMQQGIRGVPYYNPLRKEVRVLRVVIASLAADLVQIYANCRHGGNNSNMNCPNCWTTKAERLEVRDLRDHTLIRTDELTNYIISSVSSLAISEYQKKQVLRKYGIRSMERSPFAGCGVDTHQQSFRDYQHLMLHGVIKAILNVFMFDIMTKPLRVEFQARVSSFVLPHNVPRVVYTWKPTKALGNEISMKMFEQVALMAYHVLEGLIPDNLYAFYCRLWRFVVSTTYPLTTKNLLEIQDEAVEIVSLGTSLLPKVFIRPTGRLLWLCFF